MYFINPYFSYVSPKDLGFSIWDIFVCMLDGVFLRLKIVERWVNDISKCSEQL